MKKLKIVLTAIFFGLFVSSLAMAQEKRVTIYSSNPEQSIEFVSKTIEKEIPNIKVNSITGGSGVLMRRIQAEEKNVQADIFWSASYNTVGAFENFFQAYKSPVLDVISDNIRYPGDVFIPANVHVVVIMVNEDQLGNMPAPKNWKDLLDPSWKGKIVVADPANSSTGYTILWGLSKMLTPDEFKQLADNVVISASSSAVQNGVAMGEYAIGLAFEANAYPYVDGGQKEIKLIYPEDGTFITPEYAGLIKGAPGAENAKRAMDALLSQQSQIGLLQNSFRRPSRNDIEISKYVGLPELKDIKVFATNEKDAANNRADFLKQWSDLVAKNKHEKNAQ